MKLAIIADIHANLEALEAVLQDIETRGADRIYCLGDLVGYNASPSECVQAVRLRGIESLCGNHDRAVLGAEMEEASNEALETIRYARSALSPSQLDFLRSLPKELCLEEGVLLVHGSPRDPDEYILTGRALKENLQYLSTEHAGVDLCFFGHTHIPLVVGAGKVHSSLRETTFITLERFRTYMINPGSVGQPRDHCPLSSYALLDLDSYSVKIYRIGYDVERAREKVIDAGLSPLFADRLVLGK